MSDCKAIVTLQGDTIQVEIFNSHDESVKREVATSQIDSFSVDMNKKAVWFGVKKPKENLEQ